MTQELADSIKRLREISKKYDESGEEIEPDSNKYKTTDSEHVKLRLELQCEQAKSLQTINQLVELVTEMRDALTHHKDVVGILPASSSKALTKADALLTGLGEV